MHSVGWEFAWGIWGRHRLVVALVLGYLLVLVLLVNAFPLGTFDPHVIANLTIPLWIAVPYVLVLFGQGHDADIVARESGYPPRLFTLPLHTTSLVGWPLALGATAAALLWLMLAGLVLRSAGLPVPLLWPAVFLAALLAWVQALMWSTFPLPYLRMVAAVPILGGMCSGALLGYSYEVSPALLLAVSAGLVPLGYALAVAGVARARRGDGRVWRWTIRRDGRHSAPFASAAEAMFRLEWVRNGFGFPFMVGMFLVPMVGLLAFVESDPNGRSQLLIVVMMVALPPLMATQAGITLGNCHPGTRTAKPMPAFIAARPVTSAEILAAKFRVAARTNLVAWAMVCIAMLAVLSFSLKGEVLTNWTRQQIHNQGMKGWVLLLLIVIGVPALTWKRIVDQLWIGLSGREWIGYAMLVSFPVGLTALALVGSWIHLHPETHETLRAAAPWAASSAVLLKLFAGVLVARALLHRGLVAHHTAVRFAIAWIAGAVALLGLAFWLAPPEVDSPLVIGFAAVLLGLPLVRLGLAPLALDWNRHR